jgi:hypothetical protein
MLMMQYLIAKCHFKSKMMWVIEITNEATVGVIAMLLLCQGSIEGEMRTKQGSQMVYVVFGCIGINLISFSLNFLKDLFLTAKKLCNYLRVRLGSR